MIRKDFIERMIEEFGKFLSEVMALKNEGKYTKALKRIDEMYEGMIKTDPKILKSIEPDQLLDFLQNELKFDNKYIKMIADLLYEEGQIYLESGDPISAINVLGKAKVLIEYLMENDGTFGFDWEEKIAAIDKLLET